jgi:hypothetical protein
MFLVTFRVILIANLIVMNQAKLMCGVRIQVPLHVRFLIVHLVQLLVPMIRAAVVVHAFDLATRLAEHAVTIRLVHQLDRSRMFVVMTLRVLVEQVAPAEFRLVLTTLRVVQ